ncbi:VCBS repeat-containing protein [Ideonella sp. A 288]|uniref:FG-GAP repeat domain-containing protein n=1 Tax=Ideonella sp. A 288 TaxID=1962181 RepID=UPI000B4B7A78|nr:VCBS repeat-containing protein [Ideonella sp. A 288]
MTLVGPARRSFTVAAVLLACMGGGCGGGQVASVWPDPATAMASDRLATPASGRARALGVAQTVADPAADQLFNWAERQFPAHFPGHASNLTEGPWVYRSYLATGVMVGIHAGEVYVTGGAFGAGLSKVGRVTDFVQPALPVFPTSYENKHSIAFDATQVPTVRALGIPKRFDDEQDSNERSIAFADFFQEGRISAFVASGRATNRYGLPDVPDVPGVAYFLAQDADGRWVDRSGELLPTAADRVACTSASYSLVADFNGDARPDVYIACTGVDALVPGLTPAQMHDSQVSEQVLFLSQADGRYRRVAVPQRIYGHQATAADLDGDGHIDLVTTDAYNPNDALPFVLRGRGDGTFTRDDTVITSAVWNKTSRSGGLWNVFAIPVDGPQGRRLGLVLAGGDQTVWYPGNGAGGFDLSAGVVFGMPRSVAKQKPYQMPLDVFRDPANGRFYFHSTAGDTLGEEWAVLQFDAGGVSTGILDVWGNPTATMQAYSAQFKATRDGHLVAYTGGCWPTAMGACLMRVTR